MTSVSAGHAIVRQLERAGVPRAYVMPGESFLDVLDGLHDSTVRTVVARQEGGAGFMALAEGRLTDLPGVAMVTRGPGAANAMIAVHTAWQDATAMVLFVGLVPLSDRGRESFQEFDLHGWFAAMTKRVLVLDDPSRAAEIVDEALFTASSGRPGPVVVGLPEDVLRGVCGRVVVEPRTTTAPLPSPADMHTLAERVARARMPVMVVGGDGWDANAARDLMSWAKEAGIPVAGEWRGYDAVSHDEPAFVGNLGFGRSESLAQRFAYSDLHIFVGTVRTDVNSDGYLLGTDTPTILVGLDAAATGHAGRVDAHIMATAKTFASVVRESGIRSAAPTEWLRQARTAYEQFSTPHADGGDAVDLGVAMAALREELPSDFILTYGAGNHSAWPARYLRHTSPRSLAAPRNGAMGFGIPAAVAASLAHPDRLVISVAGDGCFMMNGQEFATAMATGARFVVIVVDNGVLATIAEHQEHHYPGRPSATMLTNPDFAALARSYGGHGETVERTDDFRDAFRRAVRSKLPAIVHVRTDPLTRVPNANDLTESD